MGRPPTLDVGDLLAQLDHLCSEHTKQRDATEAGIKALHDRVNQVAPSWSGSWIGHHARLYYHNFERPPPEHRFNIEWGAMRGLSGDWYEVSFEKMQAMIENHDEVPQLDDLFALARAQRDALKPIQEEIGIQMSPIRGRPGFEAEERLLDDLEEHSWGISAEDFAKYQMPKNYMTRDQRAMAEGLQPPPHIMYDSNVMAVQAAFKANDALCKKARRLLRQVELKRDVVAIGTVQEDDGPAPGVLVQICKGFHRMARQLRDRHGDRATLEVNDEYDAQDLLHAVLKLHFEDVRPEDYAPSYAGGNSRVDFLLKREQIVIEVKKTREGLKDKDLGEELIVDIARYKAHPDCKVLICFVYDPEGKVGNPRGLEADLANLASEDLQVVVFIEPS